MPSSGDAFFHRHGKDRRENNRRLRSYDNDCGSNASDIMRHDNARRFCLHKIDDDDGIHNLSFLPFRRGTTIPATITTKAKKNACASICLSCGTPNNIIFIFL
jgi:hypothetical protein